MPAGASSAWPERRAIAVPAQPDANAGERWATCSLDHVHWGANGGAGLLFRYAPEGAEPRYLLAQRSRWVDEGGTWGIPGGAIRTGESSAAAARREATEEIGEPPGYAVRAVQVQDCGGGWQFAIITADVDDPFEAYCLRETDATGWFTVDEMRALALHPGVRRWLQDG
jgi:8-oxo-dGTP diphosphatase